MSWTSDSSAQLNEIVGHWKAQWNCRGILISCENMTGYFDLISLSLFLSFLSLSLSGSLFFFLNGLYRVHNRIGFSLVEECIESTQSSRNDSIRTITALNMLREGAVASWLRCNFKHFKDPVIINSITFTHDFIIVSNKDARRLHITSIIPAEEVITFSRSWIVLISNTWDWIVVELLSMKME